MLFYVMVIPSSYTAYIAFSGHKFTRTWRAGIFSLQLVNLIIPSIRQRSPFSYFHVPI